MFHSIKLVPIQFRSNSLDRVVPSVEMSFDSRGNPINKIVYQKVPRKSFAGQPHFDPETMSLRARLNRGVQIQYVNYDCTENDPNVITAKARAFVRRLDERVTINSIASKSNELASGRAVASGVNPDTIVQHSKDE